LLVLQLQDLHDADQLLDLEHEVITFFAQRLHLCRELFVLLVEGVNIVRATMLGTDERVEEILQPGSVVQLRLGDGAGLTIHMNAVVRPDWNTQTAARIVVEAGVLVDRATLQRLPYVHRIRCDSQGTSRRVLIGTETARGTQWFTPEQCSVGPAGLVTPALDDLPNRPIARPSGHPHAEPTISRPAYRRR
jgi:hypothetical protein